MNRLFSREVYVYATRGGYSHSAWNRRVFKTAPSLSEGRGRQSKKSNRRLNEKIETDRQDLDELGRAVDVSM